MGKLVFIGVAIYKKLILKRTCVTILLLLPVFSKADSPVIDYQTEMELRRTVAFVATMRNFNVPLVFNLIECESSFNPNAMHTNKNDTADIGLFQINSVHWERAKKLGYDVKKPVDNILFGFYLLSTEGLKPWNSSKKCRDLLMLKDNLYTERNDIWRDTS